MLSIFFLFIGAYLLGSIPFSVLIGKTFYKTDVRESGSQNAGATNTFRVIGWKAGLIVLLLDVSKGIAAVCLSFFAGSENFSAEDFDKFQLLLGIIAVLGHMYPVFAGFRGGKGVATLVGMTVIVFPLATGIAVIVFVLLFAATRYVSLGSIFGSISFSVATIIIHRFTNRGILIILIVIPALVIYTHRKNIGRLLNGTESKLKSGKRSEIGVQ